MELKRILQVFYLILIILLIVPYGIETVYRAEISIKCDGF